MANAVAKGIAQSSSALYGFSKDMVLYLKDKAKYVRDLEGNLTKLIAEFITFNARKTKIDRILEKTVYEEESPEYHILVAQCEALLQKFEKFINKYHRDCQNLPSVKPDKDVRTASKVIVVIQAREPTIITRKFFTLANLSKDIKDLHDEISAITAKMNKDNAILEKELESVQVMPVDVNIPPFDKYVDAVIKSLDEDGTRSIGIAGPIAVGKTIVMKMLNNKLKGTSHSKNGIVIWIEYPKHLDAPDKIVETMQDAIIGRLKLVTGEGSSKSHIISTALYNRKYILLIDQVSSCIGLNEVGILDDHKLGKVVVASSSEKVIQRMTEMTVEIQPLSEDDAFDLFEEVCGKIYEMHMIHIAKLMVRSCGGLPRAIKSLATHLIRNKNEDVWNDVKSRLQSETKDTLQDLGAIGNAYKLVYEELRENYMKKCLLFGALFPRHHKIYKDYLVECWMAQGFLPLSRTRVLRRAREQGASVLKELTDRYLLEWCSDKYVRMPEFVRRVALEEKYPDEENSVIWVQESHKNPEKEIWTTATRMSLICSKSKLPESPESYNISTLLLQWNLELVTLGDSFFVNMQNLRVLDLYKTGIGSLPSSISSLINLASLYLNDCSRLAELPTEVKMPEQLEVLDIRGTSIRSLPKHIGSMRNLRCLRVSLGQKGCNRDNNGEQGELLIPHDVEIIVCLEQLEELTIETGCCSRDWNRIADQIANELASLKKLTSLSFHFRNACSLKRFVSDSESWKDTATVWGPNTFRSFKIFIGCCETSRHPYGADIYEILPERHLRFSTNEEASSVGEKTASVNNEETSSVNEVLRQASAFELVGHSSVQSLSEFELKNAGSLQVCVVERCKNLSWIVDASKISQPATAILQCLNKLHLFDLQSLQSIWKGSIFRGSLSNLEVLTLCGCPELMEILDSYLAKALSSLKHLRVDNCPKLEEIVKVETSNREVHAHLSNALNKLETITLLNLPMLRSICRSTSKNWVSLRKIVVIGCSNLRKLYFTPSKPKNLERIECEFSWWSELLESVEVKKSFVDHCVFIEMGLELGKEVYHDGEPSSNGRSVNPQQAPAERTIEERRREKGKMKVEES